MVLSPVPSDVLEVSGVLSGVLDVSGALDVLVVLAVSGALLFTVLSGWLEIPLTGSSSFPQAVSDKTITAQAAAAKIFFIIFQFLSVVGTGKLPHNYYYIYI